MEMNESDDDWLKYLDLQKFEIQDEELNLDESEE